jgi:hypothetical protein
MEVLVPVPDSYQESPRGVSAIVHTLSILGITLERILLHFLVSCYTHLLSIYYVSNFNSRHFSASTVCYIECMSKDETVKMDKNPQYNGTSIVLVGWEMESKNTANKKIN